MKEDQYFLELVKKHMMLKTRAWHFWKREPIQMLWTQYGYSCDYKYSFFFQLESLSSAIFAFKYGKIILLAYRLFIPIQNALRWYTLIIFLLPWFYSLFPNYIRKIGIYYA